MKLWFSSPVMRLRPFNPESLPMVIFLKLWLIQMVRIWVLTFLEISKARLFWLIIFYLHLASHFFFISCYLIFFLHLEVRYFYSNENLYLTRKIYTYSIFLYQDFYNQKGVQKQENKLANLRLTSFGKIRRQISKLKVNKSLER